VGYNTGLKYQRYGANEINEIGQKIYEYEIYSFNPQTLYGRDYYIFLICGCDPIANIVYVYSI
jgi:hypothetical protein